MESHGEKSLNLLNILTAKTYLAKFMTHIVLLGDSIFDNAVYVLDGEDVIHHIKRKIPPSWSATLLAVDGSVARDIPDQARGLLDDTTHLFLSVGGNDALKNMYYLSMRAESVAQVMTIFSRLAIDFLNNYITAVKSLLETRLPLTLCTIYKPNFQLAEQQTVATSALTFWNDVIIQTAITYKLPIIELRQIFTSPADYANSIEPSAIGADKLSNWIIEVVQKHDFNQPQTIIYGNSRNLS